MKKKLLLAAMMVIYLTVVVTGTIAYFTSEDTAHNVITSGGVKIKIIEKTKDEDGNLVDFPEEGMKIMPGSAVSKIVSVKNTGNSEAWIRVKVKSEFQTATGTSSETEMADAEINYHLSGDWSLGNDGYYYYENPLPAGEVTSVLFDKVTFSSEMGNKYQNSTMKIVVYAEAVQAANNGSTVLEAQGWPA
ncbi:MAG: SipW-dependent-type signal peptide-containing protein [Peptoniphilus sp.]|nr:SipW-dependent-type signal peptide-containing protein [Peptoniphilus sp.]